MWGNYTKNSNFNYGTIQFGSQANELFGDSSADQRAIKNGYFHK